MKIDSLGIYYNNTYFIDTYGKIIKCTWKFKNKPISMHYEIAKKLFPKIKYPKDPRDYVYNLGWIFIGGAVDIRMKDEPNQAQINTLNRLNIRWE
jgi:hypothetical protein